MILAAPGDVEEVEAVEAALAQVGSDFGWVVQGKGFEPGMVAELPQDS